VAREWPEVAIDSEVAAPQPPVLMVSIYAAHMEPVAERRRLMQGETMGIELRPGGFAIRVTVARRQVSASGMAFTPETLEVRIPPGTYVVITQLAPPPSRIGERSVAALEFARVAALIEMAHPGVLAERLYEGPVERQGSMTVWPEHGMRARATSARTEEQIVTALEDGLAATDALTDEDDERLGLASRLLMRATSEESPIDRLLALWTVLEVYTRANTNVVQVVTRSIATELALEQGFVKEALMIGRTYGFRCDIVHRGLAFVPPDRGTEFEQCAERLQAVVTYSMRRLAGLPGGDALDEYLRHPSAPETAQGEGVDVRPSEDSR
jgi:hypothetical protein